MNNQGRTALRFIIAFGVMVFCGLILFAYGLRLATKRDENQRAAAGAKSPFNGQRAYEDLKRIVAIGPRPPGSPQADQLRDFLREQLTQIGIPYREHRFEADTPIGKITMLNLVAEIKGSTPGTILIGNHYDTKYMPGITFVGANDGGSTTAWMLEMARAIGPSRKGRTLWLVWFDGEEAIKEWSDTDGLYGSREFVRDLRRRNELKSIHAMINVDMIGDVYLGIVRDPGAPPWLSTLVWTQAAELGYSSHFLPTSMPVQDDHMPFRLAQIPALELIDFEYGGSALEHRSNWHTERDTIDRVDPRSLQVVGDVLYHALPTMDQLLDEGVAGR
ncbi:MAG: M28 family peptidase [Candidatus Hydrogenedentes bacterium]|nr:M28 family peptidase [Candidatus Hydrogenedentota bacterium]